MNAITSPQFKENAKAALADPNLQQALKYVGVNFIARRREAADRLPEFDALRDSARDIKNHTLAHIDLYLEAYEERVVAQGGHVHYAPTAEDARKTILDICRTVSAKTVTKGKSMVGEEIGINAYLDSQRRHRRSRPTSANTSSRSATSRPRTSSRPPCI